jgi:molybdenum cofactor biosynthesis protein B
MPAPEWHCSAAPARFCPTGSTLVWLGPMSSHSHHKHDVRGVGCAVITVSDTRTTENDGSGLRIQELLRAHEHRITHYQILKDEPDSITAAVGALPDAAEVVIINGGTGVARRDTTYEAVTRLLDKEITGFGELFRMLSYEEIGATAMLSRATAGVAGKRIVFSVPGSTAAVELAMTKLILPTIGHVVGLARG